MSYILNKLPFLAIIIFLFSNCKKDDNPPVEPVFEPLQMTEISNSLYEISGMIFKDNMSIYAHNDGGQGAKIFEVSLNENKIHREITVSNATNLDWEDMAQDDEYFYISDSGNKWGQRTDLKVYKINKSEVATQETVTAAEINFEYSDQTDFDPTINHNYECEAMINFGDQLFLFSKNHLDQKTNLYTLSKTAGNQTANLVEEFESNGLITGATINEEKNVIVLLGYHKEVVDNIEKFDPFIWILYDFEGENIFSGKTRKFDIEIKTQMESVCFGKENTIYFSHESETGALPQFIYAVDLDPFLN